MNLIHLNIIIDIITNYFIDVDYKFNGDLGASINYQEPSTGYTALHYAVKNGNHDIANLLLKNFADTKL